MSYMYYNPNPSVKYKKDGTPRNWTKGDCAVRALCKATGFGWTEVMKVLMDRALETYDMPNSDKIIEWYLKTVGFDKSGFDRNTKKPTINEFCKNHKVGTYVIRMSGHIVTVQDGTIYDCWDCGEWKVRSFYKKAA